MQGGAYRRVVLAVLAMGVVAACGGTVHVRRGDALLRKNQHAQAIEAYEEALKEEPENQAAVRGIRTARRAMVRDMLSAVKRNLDSADYAAALGGAMRARRMPLDLEDVDLTRNIDAAIRKSAQLAEEKVDALSQKGLFVPAVDLSQAVVEATPGSKVQEDWAAGVRKKAIAHYMGLAEQLAGNGLKGSAAISLAMARQVGAEVASERIAGLWDAFSEPVCFADPQVAVQDDSGKAAAMVGSVADAARKELTELRSRCGVGVRPLGVQIVLNEVTIQDDVAKIQAAEPLPGSGIKTVESYDEEIPYTEIVEVTEEEIKIEKVEKRDCAPRPGMDRGCRTWIEDVEVKVPVKRKKEVSKIRKVKRSRPAKGPFPADKAVSYELTQIHRRVRCVGTIQFADAKGEAAHFEVDIATQDESHPAVMHPKLQLPADPQEAKSMQDVVSEAAAAVSSEVAAALKKAVGGWTSQDSELARTRVLEGQLPQAEELYLRLLALGVEENDELKQFFVDRYGKPIGEVLGVLATAMDPNPSVAAAGEVKTTGGFPKRSGNVAVDQVDPLKRTTALDQIDIAVQDEGAGSVTSVSDEELQDLEAEATGTAVPAATPPPAAVSPAADAKPQETLDNEENAGQGAEQGKGEGTEESEQQPGNAKSADPEAKKSDDEKPAPRRGPIVPR